MTAIERIEPHIAAFESALSRGRLHHAWLLTGPKGVGKASFYLGGAEVIFGVT